MDNVMVKPIKSPSMLALCALLTVACSATIEERQFQCNMDEACPDDFHCFDGFCCTSIEACENGSADAGSDAPIIGPDSAVDAPVPDAATDSGSDTYVEPDVPGCLAPAASIVGSMSEAGLVSLQISATDSFVGLSGDATVVAGGINVQSAVFVGNRLNLSYRAPRSVVEFPAGGSEGVDFTVTQGDACFRITLSVPVTLALDVITPNDESACTECASQSIDVASDGTVVFSSHDDLDLDASDTENRSDIFMQRTGEDLVLLSERWNARSQYVRIADDGTRLVYSPGDARVVSQSTSGLFVAVPLDRNCVIGGANWCNDGFAPVEVTTSPSVRVGYLQMNNPSTGVGNLADSFVRTGTDGFVRRGAEFIDMQVNGSIWGVAQQGRVFRAAGRGDPEELTIGTTADSAYFPGDAAHADEGVFQRGEAVVVVRDGDVAISFNDSTFLGASNDLSRVLVVQAGALFLLQADADLNYEAKAIQDQSSANTPTNVRLANVDRPAALSGNGVWIAALLGSPTRVARIRVE